MVLESMKLSFQTVSRYGGHQGKVLGFTTFAGGTLGGKHTLAVNLNSLKADRPDPFKVFLLAEFSK